MKMRTFGIALLFLLGFTAAFPLPAAASPAAAVYYAAPGGAGSANCSSWANACDLDSAAFRSLAEGEVWVKMGTYTPSGSGDRSASFVMKDGLSLYGGFTGTETALEQREWDVNDTVLSGDIGTPGVQTDNSYHVLTAAGGVGNSTVLDGFTIQDGYANGGGDFNNGGGIFINNSSPSLSHLIFFGNYAASQGGGMRSWTGSSPTLEHVLFWNNHSDFLGGGFLAYNGNLVLKEVRFWGNSAGIGGGGFYAEKSTIDISGGVLEANSADIFGGGIYFGNDGNSHLVLRGVLFKRNTAVVYGGGLHLPGASARLVDTVFEGNTSERGGAVFTTNGAIVSTNGLFSGNFASVAGGAVYELAAYAGYFNNTFAGNMAPAGSVLFNDANTDPSLYNSILWGNTPGGNEIGSEDADSVPFIQACLLEYPLSGGELMYANPQFVREPDMGEDTTWGTDDDDYGDLHLKRTSPAIDFGSNSWGFSDVDDADGDGDTDEWYPYDLGGGKRLVNYPGMPDRPGNTPPVVDIGAYEAQIQLFIPFTKR